MLRTGPVARRFSLRRRQIGASLVEALVALVVVGLGLLGALELQLQGMRLGEDANFANVAATQAASMMDSIAYGNQVDSAWALSMGGQQSSNPIVSAWITQLKNSLPQGQGSISCTSGLCSVQVQWTVAGETSTTATYSVTNPG
jgi:type IV pilus assembly protein PilV